LQYTTGAMERRERISPNFIGAYGLHAPRNAAAIASLLLSALSVAGAIFPRWFFVLAAPYLLGTPEL
jgi:hypothetical protein